jgi:hypothetical protein
LLKSPHYGERWGRYWLDAARYADSDGYEKDMSRQVYFYRDYVIGAFNRDLPYNQFLIEQLAGDQLPSPTQDQLVATGFLRNSMLNQEGAIDPEQFRMDAMFDRIDAVGKAMLGLTIQCAQCHNHKYDPISQEEYYRMFAFLNNDHEARPAVYSTEEHSAIRSIEKGIAEIETELQRSQADWAERMAAWEKAASQDQPEWQVIWPLHHVGENSQRYYELKDQSLLAAGYAPTKMTATFRSTNQFERHRRVPPRAAFRSQPAFWRPRPQLHGDIRADRIRCGSRRRAAVDQQGQSQMGPRQHRLRAASAPA